MGTIDLNAIQPSFQNGFARYKGDSAFPNLWDGLAGLWVPSLGIQGNLLHDFSGHKNDGTENGTVPYVIRNKGYAINFNNNASNYISIPDNQSLDPVDQFTLITSMYVDSYPPLINAYFTKWTHGTTTSHAHETSSTGRMRSFIAAVPNDGGTSHGLTKDNFVQLGRNITAVIYNGNLTGNANRLKFFNNGEQDTAITFTGTIPASIPNSSAPIKIGDYGGSISRPWLGNLEMVAYYLRALSEKEYCLFCKYFLAPLVLAKLNLFIKVPIAGLSRYHDLNGFGGQGQMTRNQLV